MDGRPLKSAELRGSGMSVSVVSYVPITGANLLGFTVETADNANMTSAECGAEPHVIMSPRIG